MSDRQASLFGKHIPVDANLTTVIVKGHLFLENALRQILTAAVFHPEVLEDVDLKYYPMAYIAKSMSYDQQTDPIWELIVGFNALRNKLAHSLDEAKLQQKAFEFVTHYFALLPPESILRKEEAAPIEKKIRTAVLYSMGFLQELERDVKNYHTLSQQRLQRGRKGEPSA